MSGMSTVWLYTNSCAQQYMLYLATYLMTVLSYLYGIIMYCTINAPGNGNNVVDVINAADKLFLKVKRNFLVNYQVTTHQILELFPVHQKMSPLNLQNNVYTLSIAKIG